MTSDKLKGFCTCAALEPEECACGGWDRVESPVDAGDEIERLREALRKIRADILACESTALRHDGVVCWFVPDTIMIDLRRALATKEGDHAREA